MDNVIETQELTKGFGNILAVNKLNLNVQRGSIFAFLGPNGAGKTTTIKLLMNIITPSKGISTVFGIPSSKLGPKEFSQIGYVSENQKIPEWMTIEELIAYCKPMYPTWDDTFCQRLIQQFDLPSKQRIKGLSRGLKVKATLVSSLAYRPKLLVLDEPFSGLDPLVRDEFIRGILELTESTHWTIFISSHDIAEVENLADWVGIIDKGTLKLVEETEVLYSHFRKVEVINTSSIESLPPLPEHWLFPAHQGCVVTFIDTKYEKDDSERRVRTLFPNCLNITDTPMSLREIFIALAKTFRLSEREEIEL